jgi:uncharacterized protein (TIGR03437 family)
MKNKLATILFTLGAAAALHAAPRLRLTTTAVGPVLVAQGSNGTINPGQLPYAFNIGDGTLNLKISSSDSWLVATLGTISQSCQGGVKCTPVQISLQTSSLAKGSYTGFVTVADPNAVDAPQTVSVTVYVGGNVPDQITLYTAPGGATTTSFAAGENYPSSVPIATPTTQSGGSWLSVAGSGIGSFQFAVTFTVTANAANLAAGDYNGSVAISGSPFGGDNKTVPTVLHVTTQPIALPTSSTVQFQIAQGAAKQNSVVSLVNAGQGAQSALTVSGATVATSSGGSWLSAATSGNAVTLTADPLTLAPGTYKGTLTVNSNAVNGTATIPVQLTVVATGPPVANSVLNVFTNSSDDGLSQGEVVAVYGTQFTTGDPQTGSLPLQTTLGTTQVLLNGQPVPIQYVAASQINIQIPYDATLGDGTLTVVRGGQKGNAISVNINSAAPAVLPFPFTTYVLAQTATGGFEGYKVTPGTLGSYLFPQGAPAHIGDTVVLYAVGLGATSPAVTAGTAAPSSPLAMVTPTPMVCLGALNPLNPTALCSAPQFAGLTPGFFGLYQVNFLVPQNAPTGDAVPIFVQVGNAVSNILSIAIQ